MKVLHAAVLVLPALVLVSGCTRTDRSKRGAGADGRQVIQNKGSDTLVNVAQAWAEAYRKKKPEVAIAVSGGGSGTGISAMINGTVDLANSSREMKTSEVEAAKKNGVEAVEHTVGFDAVAIYVHKNNPIESITIAQLAAIYGEGGQAETWSDVGVTVPGAKDNKIIRVSRQNNSGTYVYFRRAILSKTGEYKLGSLDLHGSKDVVDLVEKTPGAIGYSGLAYKTDHVKMVPVIGKEGAPVTPSPQTAVDGSYPIARPLLMYTGGEPQGAVKAYLEWVLSDEGQRIIQDKGYAPVRALQ